MHILKKYIYANGKTEYFFVCTLTVVRRRTEGLGPGAVITNVLVVVAGHEAAAGKVDPAAKARGVRTHTATGAAFRAACAIDRGHALVGVCCIVTH